MTTLRPLTHALVRARLATDGPFLAGTTAGPLLVPADWPGELRGLLPRWADEDVPGTEEVAGIWVVVDETHEPPAAVGDIGTKGPPRDGRVEIGYAVVEEARRRGHASAAVRLLVETLRAANGAGGPGATPVAEVVAETVIGNRASERVLEATGFTATGTRTSEEDGVVTVWRLPLR